MPVALTLPDKLAPCKLSEDEKLHPWLVLHNFFDYSDILAVRENLWELFKVLVTGEYVKSSFSYRNRKDIVYFYEHLEKLIEAAHLLYWPKEKELYELSTRLAASKRAPFLYSEDNRILAPTIQTLVQVIMEAVDPDFVFILGEVTSRKAGIMEPGEEESSDSSHTNDQPSYFFLILMSSHLTRSTNEYVDVVEARCGSIAPVTAIVKTVKQAAKYLKEGNWFFCTNCRKSKLVYQKGTTEVEDLTGITSLEEIDTFKAKAKSWYAKGSAFMDGGCFHVAKHQYSTAIFLFHQALENYLTAVLLYRTGYRERTHNLSKLIRYCSLWVPEITGVFAEINRRDQNLLKKLQRAYNDSRYKEDYSITPEEVGKVMRIFKDIHPYIRDIMQLTE